MHRKPGSLARNRLHQPVICRCAGRLFALSAGRTRSSLRRRRVPAVRRHLYVFNRVLMTPGELHCGSEHTSYNPTMSTSDDGPKARPIPSEDDEKYAPGDARSDDRTDEPETERRWWSIGRRFVEGIPFTKMKRH